MDGDSQKKNEEGDPSNPDPYISNILQPTWIRRAFQDGDGLDRFLLDYGFNFLLRFGVLLHLVLFIKETL